MELQNCTGTKFKDTCDVSCDKEFNRTVSYVSPFGPSGIVPPLICSGYSQSISVDLW